MGRKSNSTPSFIESEVTFITETLAIILMIILCTVCKLRKELPKSSEPSYLHIKDQIMKSKNCTFELCKVIIEDEEK